MVPHSEPSANQIGHTASRPQIGSEPVSRRLLRNPLQDRLFLGRSQKPRSPRRWFRGESGGALFPVSGHPFGDGYRMDAQKLRNRHLRPTIPEFLDGGPSPRFQFESSSFASHPKPNTTSSSALNSFVYLRISRPME
jgi:hypothetical protein